MQIEQIFFEPIQHSTWLVLCYCTQFFWFCFQLCAVGYICSCFSFILWCFDCYLHLLFFQIFWLLLAARILIVMNCSHIRIDYKLIFALMSYVEYCAYAFIFLHWFCPNLWMFANHPPLLSRNLSTILQFKPLVDILSVFCSS